MVSFVDQKVNFLRIELTIGRTMVKLAYTERGMLDQENAGIAILNAGRALETVRYFLPTVATSREVVDELQREADELHDCITFFLSTDEQPSPPPGGII